MGTSKTRVKQRKMTRAQKLAREKQMAIPVNRFLNSVDDKGKLLWPAADKLRRYFFANPDPAIDSIRMANALVHELRFHQEQVAMYQREFDSGITKITTPEDVVMSMEQIKLKIIEETQVCYLTVSKLRKHITDGVFKTCDDITFPFEKFNEYVLTVDAKIKELGYDLFPETVEIIAPL